MGDPSSSLWRCFHRPWRSFHCLRAASTGRRGSFFVLVEMSSPSLEKLSLFASSLYRSKRILLRPCGDVFTVLGEVVTVCEQPLPVEEDPSSSLWRCLHRPWRSCHCLRDTSPGRRGSFFVPVVFTVLGEVFTVCGQPLP